MKKNNRYFIAILLIATLFSACNKSEVHNYIDVDRVNFLSSDKYTELSDYDETGFQYKLEFQKTGAKELVLEVGLFVQGRTADHDRKVSFKIVDSTSTGVDMELEPAIIKAGEGRGVAKIIVKRPSSMSEELATYIVIDHENSDFDEGTLTRNKILISATDVNDFDVFEIGDWFWDEYTSGKLGAWCFGKIRFIYYYYDFDSIWDWVFGGWSKEQIQSDLEEYKLNPDNSPIYDETKFPEKVWIDFEI